MYRHLGQHGIASVRRVDETCSMKSFVQPVAPPNASARHRLAAADSPFECSSRPCGRNEKSHTLDTDRKGFYLPDASVSQ